jgi:hypothetical protein
MATPRKWCAEESERLADAHGFDYRDGLAQLSRDLELLGLKSLDLADQGQQKAIDRLLAYGAFDYLRDQQ